MPIYEYACQDCSHKFEVKQSMKDDPVAPCTRCGKPVGRIISAPAIMFKGSGWYVTDYSDKMKPPTGESSEAGPDAKKDPKENSTTASAAPSAPTAPASPAPSGGGTATTTTTPTNTPPSGSSSSST